MFRSSQRNTQPGGCRGCGAAAPEEFQGVYVCPECGMQSQEQLVELTEWTAGINTTEGRHVRKRRTRKRARTEPPEPPPPRTVAIAYCDAMQRHLEALCVALVASGSVPPAQPELAQRLWRAYLPLTTVFELQRGPKMRRARGGASAHPPQLASLPEGDEDEDGDDEEPGGVTDSDDSPDEERGEEEPPAAPPAPPESRKLRTQLHAQLPLLTPLALAFLAGHLLRAALLHSDLVRGCLDGSLPYLGFHATLPPEITQLVPVSMLMPAAVPAPRQLHVAAAAICAALQLPCPPANAPALAQRFALELRLPRDAAHAAGRLLLLHEAQGLWLGAPPGAGEQHIAGDAPPSVHVMAALLFVLKARYGLGDKASPPAEETQTEAQAAAAAPGDGQAAPAPKPLRVYRVPDESLIPEPPTIVSTRQLKALVADWCGRVYPPDKSGTTRRRLAAMLPAGVLADAAHALAQHQPLPARPKHVAPAVSKMPMIERTVKPKKAQPQTRTPAPQPPASEAGCDAAAEGDGDVEEIDGAEMPAAQLRCTRRCKSMGCCVKSCPCFRAGARCGAACRCLGCLNGAPPAPPLPAAVQLSPPPTQTPLSDAELWRGWARERLQAAAATIPPGWIARLPPPLDDQTLPPHALPLYVTYLREHVFPGAAAPRGLEEMARLLDGVAAPALAPQKQSQPAHAPDAHSWQPRVRVYGGEARQHVIWTSPHKGGRVYLDVLGVMAQHIWVPPALLHRALVELEERCFAAEAAMERERGGTPSALALPEGGD